MQAVAKPVAEIVAALTKRPPLNERQTFILATYWRAWRDGEPPLPISTIAERLAAEQPITGERASAYVEGALRAFGKRLGATLSEVPLLIGTDRLGDGVADALPLLAMFQISKGPDGRNRHKLTDSGAAAVAMSLGLTQAGTPAATPLATEDSPDEIVTLAMTRHSAALVFRVMNTIGSGVDDAIQQATARMGAG